MVDDTTGTRYGKLVMLRHVATTRHGKHPIWLVRCDCGIEKLVRRYVLRNGSTKTCGGVGCKIVTPKKTRHVRRAPADNETKGTRYGRVVCLEHVATTRLGKHPLWLVRCDCGLEKLVRRPALRNGSVKTCGSAGCKSVTHGKCYSITYSSWASMKGRCTRKTHPVYHRYGGIGVTMQESWLTFDGFFADMGERPSRQHSLDRIDGTKGYTAENCRWASSKQQANNRKTNVHIEWLGQKKTLAEWAREYGIQGQLIRARQKRGVDIGQLFLPARPRGGKI